jgi:hypothetical protein
MTDLEKTRTREQLTVSINFWNDEILKLIASGATRSHINSPLSRKLKEARDTVDRLYTLLDIFAVKGGDI